MRLKVYQLIVTISYNKYFTIVEKCTFILLEHVFIVNHLNFKLTEMRIKFLWAYSFNYICYRNVRCIIFVRTEMKDQAAYFSSPNIET